MILFIKAQNMREKNKNQKFQLPKIHNSLSTYSSAWPCRFAAGKKRWKNVTLLVVFLVKKIPSCFWFIKQSSTISAKSYYHFCLYYILSVAAITRFCHSVFRLKLFQLIYHILLMGGLCMNQEERVSEWGEPAIQHRLYANITLGARAKGWDRGRVLAAYFIV